TSNQNPAENAESKSVWIISGANLLKYKPSGVYFARVRIKGKLYRASLKTTSMQTAKDKLADFVKEKKKAAPNEQEWGKWTMGDAVALFLTRLDGKQDIKDSSKRIRKNYLNALLRTWPELNDKRVSKVTIDDCLGVGQRVFDLR